MSAQSELLEDLRSLSAQAEAEIIKRLVTWLTQECYSAAKKGQRHIMKNVSYPSDEEALDNLDAALRKEGFDTVEVYEEGEYAVVIIRW